MYSVAVTTEEPRVFMDETGVVRYALAIAAAYGNYSGMEGWSEDSMVASMNTQLSDIGRLDLYISGPETIDFCARREVDG